MRTSNALPISEQEAPTRSHDAAAALDATAQEIMARLNSGLSPVSLALALTDWTLHMATSPGTRSRLGAQAQALAMQWLTHSMPSLTAEPHPERQQHPLVEALAQDPRFSNPAWNRFPWSSLASANKALELWWHEASELRGMSDHSSGQMRFYTRQALDLLSPGNWLPSNPEAIHKAIQSGGGSLLEGAQHAVDELRLRHGLDPAGRRQPDPRPGQGLAMTPGEVVMRNHLIELIQYAPTTREVQKEPVLIIPSIIMKYYILDLSPENSMVKWLVAQGHTVFILSWRNPDEGDALLGLDDYVRVGVLEALDHVRREIGQPVHLAGYCLGGTFAAMAAAALQGRHAQVAGTGEPLASLTLMAAETDFTEPGEMGTLIDESQVDMLEAVMAEKGFLTGRQMAGAFQFLHSRDLVWSQRTKSLLLGEPAFTNDLMIWNADVTRLPAVMHSQYLRRMYLHNDLANARYVFEGQTLSLRDIRTPLFAVGTVKDHVSPWRSVFKIHHLVTGEVTFVLTNGGHNAGIVSEPGHAGRSYQLLTTEPQQARRSPDNWVAVAPHHEGSWWKAWHEWLTACGAEERVPARLPTGHPALGTAPGEYVMVRYAD